MFVYGTQSTEKEEWQTNFSVNKLQSAIRTAQGKLYNILVNNPDWYDFEPRSYTNKQAAMLAPTFKKITDYYLESANFKRHASTFFMCSLISTGSIYIGWKYRLIQNPEYILDKTEKARKAEAARLAKKVSNPQVDDAVSQDDMVKSLEDALDELVATAQGEEAPKKRIPEHIQVGCLDLFDPNHEWQYWDPNVAYMEDSPWRAFKKEVNLYEINHMAKLGFYSKDKVKKLKSSGPVSSARNYRDNVIYKNTTKSASSKENKVELLVYTGPLIIDNEVVKERYFCVIADGGTIIKEGEYPFWEPPGHHTPVITSAVRQVPYRATGAGIGDSATGLQKMYDSNWQIVCDSFRTQMGGIDIVDMQAMVDKSALAEGKYPGMILEVRGDPDKVFKHVDYSTNIEAQARPVQNMLEQAIDSLTGVNELMVGGNNQFSRTSAAETNARLGAGTENVNIIALDLEQNFLIPALKKVFSRILQFGLLEINTNPELQALLTQEEQYELQNLNAQSRLEILNQYYSFKIKGFSSSQDQDLAAQRDNEFLSIVNSGGPLAAYVNIPNFIKRYFKNRDVKDPDELLIVDNNPMTLVTATNQLLLQNIWVQPNEGDDHELYLKVQTPLAQGPQATPALQQHVQMRMQMLQQLQATQQPQPGQEQPVQ